MNMSADEKLMALKKAYADVLLNISKEAAARIVSSERRTARYQHELKMVKEEALGMLLRFKHMMDSKSSEAEAASLKQQQKIEELEAQLQEAEDIVKDLREELGEVQVELDGLKNDSLHVVNDHNNACSRETVNTNYSCQSCESLHRKTQDEFHGASDLTLPNPSHKCCDCHSKTICMCKSSAGTIDLPSMTLRDKELGLYRNGCTQRIRACERNILGKEFCIAGDTNTVKDKNNGIGHAEGEDTCRSLTFGPKGLSELEMKLLADMKLNSFQPLHLKRTRATRQRKNLTALSRKPFDPLQEPYHGLSAKCDSDSVKESALPYENPSKPAPMLFPDRAETHLVEKFSGRTLQIGEGLKEQMMSTVEEIGFPLSLCSADYKMDVENVDMLLRRGSSPPDTIRGHPDKPAKERVIKYTFQRKRKREALSGSKVKAFFESEKIAEDKQNGDLNLEGSKSSLLIKSTRDSRRLAEVARQVDEQESLISLSEKKWWD